MYDLKILLPKTLWLTNKVTKDSAVGLRHAIKSWCVGSAYNIFINNMYCTLERMVK